MAKNFVWTCYSFGAKINLQVTFWNKQLKINRAKAKKAYADNVATVIPVDFNEESWVEITAKPFSWHVPNAIKVILVAFKHAYLE